jgi:predicted transposase YbfD/YdcC
METLLTILGEVCDPRDLNRRHHLDAMLFMALVATLCGARSCVEIADFADANEDLFAEIVDLPHGIPSHDCFNRTFRLLDPDQLERALARFASALRQGLRLGPPKGVVAIDGKSLRRGFERGRAHLPPMLVGVWDAETRLSIAARRVAGGDEVGATLEVLACLSLKGCIVTADALHCHPRMARAVRAAGAHYALGLRGNHGPLLASAKAAFERAERRRRLPCHETVERGHGRAERRRVEVVARPATAPAFPGLAALARITAERRDGAGRTTTAVRHVALSRRLSPARVAQVVRAHWSIENELHWRLDVVFHEDDARVRKNHAAHNLAVIRRLSLDILRAHPLQRSIARKMRLAAWQRPFLLDLFTHMQ